MSEIERIELALPHPHLSTVNVWLLRGEPLTLVDTGMRHEATLAALQAALAERGVRLEDVELVLLTHHHVEHVGLAPEIRRRSGASIAALDRVLDRCAAHDEHTTTDRVYANALMATHGVPERVIAGAESFWELQRSATRSFTGDIRLADGGRIRAGGRDLRAVFRPGHSLTDTLLVDDRDEIAFVGDHLLAAISSNTEILPEPGEERPRARVKYLEGLRRTAAIALQRLFTGHGDVIADHARLIRERLAHHEARAARITALLREEPANAWQLGRGLWRDATMRRQPLLVTWEVLGHLDVLCAAGSVRERIDAHGRSSFVFAGARAA